VGEGKHEIIVLAGEALNLESVQIHTRGTKEINPDIARALATHVDGEVKGEAGEAPKKRDYATPAVHQARRLRLPDLGMAA
jgi:hypothetical protein